MKIAVSANANEVYHIVLELAREIVANLLWHVELRNYLIIEIGNSRSWEESRYIGICWYRYSLNSTYEQWASRCNLDLYLYSLAGSIVEVEVDALVAHRFELFEVYLIPNIFTGFQIDIDRLVEIQCRSFLAATRIFHIHTPLDLLVSSQFKIHYINLAIVYSLQCLEDRTWHTERYLQALSGRQFDSAACSDVVLTTHGSTKGH